MVDRQCMDDRPRPVVRQSKGDDDEDNPHSGYRPRGRHRRLAIVLGAEQAPPLADIGQREADRPTTMPSPDPREQRFVDEKKAGAS